MNAQQRKKTQKNMSRTALAGKEAMQVKRGVSVQGCIQIVPVLR